MPFPLFSIPAHIRQSIIQKTDLVDFVNYKRSSHEAFEDSQKVKTKFSIESLHLNSSRNSLGIFHLEYSNQGLGIQYYTALYKWAPFNHPTLRVELLEFPVRLEKCDFEIRVEFTEKFCNGLTTFVEQTNSSINKIILWYPECSPNALKQLVETAKIKEVEFRKLNPEFMEVEAIRNVGFVSITQQNSLRILSEADILNLKALKFDVSANISIDCINQILKELVDGRRRIDYCSIETRNVDFNKILRGIPILCSKSCTVETVIFGTGTLYKLTFDDLLDILEISRIEQNCAKRKYSNIPTVVERYKNI